MEIKISDNSESVARNFAEHLCQTILKSSETVFNIALSGGSTPKLLFQILAAEYLDSINWDKVNLFWGDERCVPPTHQDSNYKMTEDNLLSKVAIPDINMHRVKGEISPIDAAIEYSNVLSNRLPSKSALPQFDMIILGLGSDGHTASIFPHQLELLNSEQICAVATHPESGQKRVTITGKTINNADQICFLVTGDAKSQKVAQIINGAPEAQGLPASFINPTEGQLLWFLDKEAASLL